MSLLDYVYVTGNGGESTAEQDFYGGLRATSARSPSSQQSSPLRSLNSIKVELCSDEESSGARQSENKEAVGSDSGKNDRAGPAEEGGAAFAGSRGEGGNIYNETATPNSASPGPIRLPNGKLQCEVCGMVCIGPNVLMVHKRSHTGERPFQCNQCGASFTQKGNLLRHIKLHSGEKPFKCPVCSYACRRRDALAGHLRTHTVSSPTVGKPYKCTYCSRSYKQQSTLEEHLERCHSYMKTLEPAQMQLGEESVNMESISKPALQPSNEKRPFVDRLTVSITKRKRSTPQKFLGEKHMHLEPPEAPYELSSGSEKEGDLLSSHSAGDSSGLVSSHLHFARGKDSTDTESTAEEQSTRASAPTTLPRSLPTASPSQAKDLETEWGPVPPGVIKRNQGSPLSARNNLQVLDRAGRPVRSFYCRHCCILFLDHVMYTIHMGCHGFRQPFECNICGHPSQDRYEFSSHISRGEHQVG
uniref:IKAROS family zinc finger 4 n=1 Tax=Cyprinodon variegatus TaxID=28743 RepID=A0A3Q2D0B6_CYPVA